MADPKELVRSLYAAFAEGDAGTVLGAFHPDIVWNEAEGNPLAEGNPYRGPQAVGEGIFGRLAEDLDGFAVAPELLVAEGPHVVAMGRYTGTHRASGDPLDAQFVHHWTVEDGRVTRFQQYTDTEQWTRLYAAG